MGKDVEQFACLHRWFLFALAKACTHKPDGCTGLVHCFHAVDRDTNRCVCDIHIQAHMEIPIELGLRDKFVPEGFDDFYVRAAHRGRRRELYDLSALANGECKVAGSPVVLVRRRDLTRQY